MGVFGDRLRESRLEKGLTQQKMADILDVQLRAYQHYESDTRHPTFEKLAMIAKTLNVSTDYLLGITDDD